MNDVAKKVLDYFLELFPDTNEFIFKKLSTAALSGKKIEEDLETLTENSAAYLMQFFSKLSRDNITEWFQGLLLQEYQATDEYKRLEERLMQKLYGKKKKIT